MSKAHVAQITSMRLRDMHRSTKTKRKQSIKACKTCTGRHARHARAGVPMSGERRSGLRIRDKYLRTHVRAECTTAGANIRYRLVLSDDVDDTAKVHGRSTRSAHTAATRSLKFYTSLKFSRFLLNRLFGDSNFAGRASEEGRKEG